MTSLLTTKVVNHDFAYYDSGAGSDGTVIVIHGNTYHAGKYLSYLLADVLEINIEMQVHF